MASADVMTPRERWLAAVRMEPIDRLPFWPKLTAAYAQAQDAPFHNMDVNSLHDWIGSDKHVGIVSCVREVRNRTSRESVTEGCRRRTVFQTRFGNTALVEQYDAVTQSWHPVAYPAQTLQDIRILTEFFLDCRVELDNDLLEKARAQAEQLGSDAVTASGIGTSALMDWVQHLAGIENGHVLLFNHTDAVTELFEAIHATLLQRARLVCEHSPADLLYLTENTSTTLVSPEQYRRYWFPHIKAYAEVGRAARRLLVLHMCGHLKLLLRDLGAIPVAAFEAFTSPKVGDTTLLDGRLACPDKCLIGGTNAVLWTRPADEIIAELDRDLRVLPHHRGVVVTSAGVMPLLCRPETIRKVCQWVRSYKARM